MTSECTRASICRVQATVTHYKWAVLRVLQWPAAQMLITCPFLPCSQMIQTSQTLLENSDSVYERILQVQKAGKNEKPYERTKAKTLRRARERERHGVPQGTGVSWNTADRRGPSIAAPSEIERKHKCVHTKKAQRERTNYATLCYIRLIVHFSSPVWCVMSCVMSCFSNTVQVGFLTLNSVIRSLFSN